ncbi:uncharacterized protein LOC124303447 [Neodiprion virginianus]|uniref:uncharacterized protein LOC124303447 n=1 Tax=Neodiprion virginianus TaxID=2961670 RepID=UPI001EE6AD72|nr:uncharacterized protein LOC124303447 [Neodiprion virginianus]
MNRYLKRKKVLKTMPKKKNQSLKVKSVRSTIQSSGRPTPRPYETEEEAIIRRFHDAQRMARFRAKRKKALEQREMLESSGLARMTVVSETKKRNLILQLTEPFIMVSNSKTIQSMSAKRLEQSPTIHLPLVPDESKYSQLLSVIEELGKDIRLTYAGSRTSVERLKVGIVRAKLLVRDCLLETEVNSKL